MNGLVLCGLLAALWVYACIRMGATRVNDGLALLDPDSPDAAFDDVCEWHPGAGDVTVTDWDSELRRLVEKQA